MEFAAPRNIAIPADWGKLYGKLRPFSRDGQLLKKPKEDEYPKFADQTGRFLSNYPYLWNTDAVHQPTNQAEKEFDLKRLKPIAKIGILHSYGGYYGFFKPDLLEVIKCAQDQIRACAASTEVIFVRTETCDKNGNLADRIHDCFCDARDAHYGLTTLYVLDSSDSIESSDLHDSIDSQQPKKKQKTDIETSKKVSSPQKEEELSSKEQD